MREYQHKYILRTLIYSPVTIIVLFLMIILLLRSIMELNDKRIAVEAQREEAQIKEEDLKMRLGRSEEKVKDIRTDRGFEAYVRTTFPVVREGEGVIVVYDNEANLVTPVREGVTIWEKLLIWWRHDVRQEVDSK